MWFGLSTKRCNSLVPSGRMTHLAAKTRAARIRAAASAARAVCRISSGRCVSGLPTYSSNGNNEEPSKCHCQLCSHHHHSRLCQPCRCPCPKPRRASKQISCSSRGSARTKAVLRNVTRQRPGPGQLRPRPRLRSACSRSRQGFGVVASSPGHRKGVASSCSRSCVALAACHAPPDPGEGRPFS